MKKIPRIALNNRVSRYASLIGEVCVCVNLSAMLPSPVHADVPMCRCVPPKIRTQDTRKTTTPLRLGTHQVHRLSLTSTHRSPRLEALDPGRVSLRLLLPHGYGCWFVSTVTFDGDGRMTDWDDNGQRPTLTKLRTSASRSLSLSRSTLSTTAIRSSIEYSIC